MLNRIIGILVVLAVGILVYPFVFNSHDNFGGHSESIRIPPFPGPQTQNDTIRALSQNSENSAEAVKAAKLANTKQKKITATMVSPEIKGKKHAKPAFKSVAWVVQVGTYRDKINALSLVNQLRAKGYNAFIHQTHAAFGDEVQVYIGPETKRDAAALLATKLAKETKLSGVIKTYKLLSA